MTTNGIASARARGLPTALIGTLVLACTLTALAWCVAVFLLATPRHKLLVLGDSYAIAHLVHPGGRLEDWLQRDLGDGWSVRNFGEINAHTGDHYLELSKARLVRFDPDLVVIGLSPHKLVPDDEQQLGHRFRNHDANLKWLPWNAEGLRFFQTLSSTDKVAAFVQNAGLLVGVYDLLDTWFNDRVTRPRLRAHLLHCDPSERERRIAKYTAAVAKHWETFQLGSYDEVSHNQESRDLRFLVEALRAQHTRTVALILPAGDAPVMQQRLSPRARAKLETSYRYTLRFCDEIGLSVVDFNTVEQRSAFSAEDWDDIYHLKAARAYERLANGASAWLHSAPAAPHS